MVLSSVFLFFFPASSIYITQMSTNQDVSAEECKRETTPSDSLILSYYSNAQTENEYTIWAQLG